MDTTDAQSPRTIAENFYRRFDANDVAGALDLMADDASFWIAGKPGASPSAGEHSKDEMAAMFRRMGKRLRDGLRMQVKAVTAEGDRVALEVQSHGELLNGRVYDQEYHALMLIRGGKIAAVREYMDTQHVHDIWYRD
ncbi:nuclear transport factor 2 family protein [uncultured Ramlibacter sp.]|uniref:nuclear transport factor 2 family protein n=1 Tax=uncultured Ramlibacter sp. TaxID=260755 RepID=UPI002606FA53|nr:nuclear transport factor 2 family protein [uncultured Ramlibacter sp.]